MNRFAALDKLRRSLEFISRNDFAKIDSISGLERSINAWLDELEAEHPQKSVLSILKALRWNFAGFDTSGPEEKRVRLSEALRLLKRIEGLVGSADVSNAQIPPDEARSESSRKEELHRPGSLRRCERRPEKPSLADSVQTVHGIGPKRAEVFGRLGIRTVGDALFFLPRKYVDRSRFQPISALQPGLEQTFSGTVLGSGVAYRGRGRRRFEVTIADSTAVVTAVWFVFRKAYMEERYPVGRSVVFSGVIRSNARRSGRLEIHHPDVEVLDGEDGQPESLHMGRVVSFYPSTEGVHQKSFRTFIRRVVDDFADQVVDVIPPEITARRNLVLLRDALRGVHFPPSPDETVALPPEETTVEALNAGISSWHRRLIFDELFTLQTGLAIRRNRRLRSLRPIRYEVDGPLTGGFLERLLFSLTPAQKRVIGEIAADFRSSSPMNRLLQGDVGSGKTVIAVWSAMAAIQSGHQAALLAPTEILAEQHAANVRRWTDPLGVTSGLLTGRMSLKEQESLLARVADGTVGLLVGTHALIQERVRFQSLALSIVDEQHRFGVLQRSALQEKGQETDTLIMTATPIPRSLSLTLYGELDLSVLDEMPPGRVPIETRVSLGGGAEEEWDLLLRELRGGRQGYFVYPLVEETERSDLEAAVESADKLGKQLDPLRVGLLHGRMKGEEKEVVMDRFRNREIDLLVTTIVVEVGVDVPNATVMWVEHADRYGLAQLHQLRGRVGRGCWKSYCILRASPPLTDGAEARLSVMAETNDGFVVADRDLEIRGAGEVFGIRQAGAPDLRLIRLLRHTDLLFQAREDAFRLVESDPELSRTEHRELKAWVRERWGERLDLAAVG